MEDGLEGEGLMKSVRGAEEYFPAQNAQNETAEREESEERDERCHRDRDEAGPSIHARAR